MCGIAGVFGYGSRDRVIDLSELVLIRDHMKTRGPDAHGIWHDQECYVALAHRRLSVIDLTPEANQPMKSVSGRFIIVFNGEIYNYDELRAQLIADGCTFATRGDTEVILNLFERHGPDMVSLLRGMFAIAIWDLRDRRLFVARDPYGIKPLYYSDNGSHFRFASSVKALVAGGSVSTEPDFGGQAGFFMTGSVPEPLTIYKAIQSLPAGTWAFIGKSGMSDCIKYLDIRTLHQVLEPKAMPVGSKPPHQVARSALLDSVRHHLVADVEVGAFLSGGVDSTALIGMMRDAGAKNVQAVTLRFSEFEGSASDETEFATIAAKHYGARHHIRTVTPAEFKEDLPRILHAMDLPTIDGINTWFASKAMSELGVKVAFSGLGGDELFGGYPSFNDLPSWQRKFSLAAHIPGLGIAVRRIGSALLGRSSINPKAYSIIEMNRTLSDAYMLRRAVYAPWELKKLMGPGPAKIGLERLHSFGCLEEAPGLRSSSYFNRIAALESSLYMRNQLLRDCDWASMAHSVELRLPLVDVQLTRSIGPLAAASVSGKDLLGRAPTKPLPATILDKPKTGFAIPVGEWIGLAMSQKKKAHGYSREWCKHVASATFGDVS